MTDLARIPDNQLNVPTIPTGTYRHYKGNEYHVIGTGLDTETMKPVVIYSPVHSSNVVYWIRPYDMFIETVTVDGKEVPRFQLVNGEDL